MTLIARGFVGITSCFLLVITKAPRVGASFSTARSEPGIMGEGFGWGEGVPILDGFCCCPAGHGRFSGVGFWVVFGQDSRSPFWVSFGRFSGAFQEVHEGIWGRRLMRAFGGCFGRVLSSLSADEPVSHAVSIVELSSQPVALKLYNCTVTSCLLVASFFPKCSLP